jgi:signal transduction histidine kinase
MQLKQLQYLEIILRNAKRLERLTHDILQVARIESNSLVINRERVNMYELINSIITDFKEITVQKGIKIKFTCQCQQSTNNNNNNCDDYEQQQLKYPVNNQQHPEQEKSEEEEKEARQQEYDSSVVVNCDREKITEVIYNLLSNSVKFTEEKRKRMVGNGNGGDGGENHNNNDRNITIIISLHKINNNTSNFLVVTIKDTGTGIAADIMPRLFTKFATKSFQGTGLGLYISKKIVEAHGGKIWAENNNDGEGGATFGFSLPTSTNDV